MAGVTVTVSLLQPPEAFFLDIADDGRWKPG
jgi:hypothetical protein